MNPPNPYRDRQAASVGIREARRVLDAQVAEKDFQVQVVELAGLFGWRHFHDLDSRRNVAGFPDLVLVRPPRLVFAELKTEKGPTTVAQMKWLADLRACPGVEAYTWRLSDWTAIEAALGRSA